MPVTPTDITGGTGTGTFDYFQSAGAPFGAVLTGVELRISVTETLQSLSVTNNDQVNQQSFTYVSFSNLTPVGTGPGADLGLLNAAINANAGVNGDIDLIDTGNLLYNPNEIKIFAPPPVSDTNDTGLVNAANILPYDTTGSFNLGFTTQTFQSFIGGGGNASNVQVTDAVATVQVRYTYEGGVPEPGTAVLAALAMCGLGIVRRTR